MPELIKTRNIHPRVVSSRNVQSLFEVFSNSFTVSESGLAKIGVALDLADLFVDIGMLTRVANKYSVTGNSSLSLPLSADNEKKVVTFIDKQGVWDSLLPFIIAEHKDATEKSLVLRHWPSEYPGYRLLLQKLGLLSADSNEPHIFKFNINKSLMLELDLRRNKKLNYQDRPVEKLLLQQEKNRQLGELAEKYVFDFECRRLERDDIMLVSEIDYAAGFDIASFSSNQSVEFDRFIEVKSYSLKCRFFWSKNEMKVAKEIGNKYFLYLVDRSQMHDAAYEPQIVQNPAKKLFSDENWLLEEDGFQVVSIY
jgi:hypothetical protein